MREEGAREPHATHDIDFKKAEPVCVGNFKKGLGLEDADIIDEDVNSSDLLQQLVDSRRADEIGGDSGDAGASLI
jgi:hypothetical protein